MTTARYEPTSTLVMKAVEAAALNERELRQINHGELVRGEDASLLERIEPLVRQSSVMLDLGGVERIDAAGITALICLYRSARDSGHCFHVTNVPARVCQILKMVGLDRILVSHNAVEDSQYGPCSQLSAA
ncbi:MAG: STAS domain-containing protein [Terracidiphilus sp.]